MIVSCANGQESPGKSPSGAKKLWCGPLVKKTCKSVGLLSTTKTLCASSGVNITPQMCLKRIQITTYVTKVHFFSRSSLLRTPQLSMHAMNWSRDGWPLGKFPIWYVSEDETCRKSLLVICGASQQSLNPFLVIVRNLWGVKALQKPICDCEKRQWIGEPWTTT